MPHSEDLPTMIENARLDAQRWHLKLEELKTAAEKFNTTAARDGMMRLAESYSVMARRAESKVEALERDAGINQLKQSDGDPVTDRPSRS